VLGLLFFFFEPTCLACFVVCLWSLLGLLAWGYLVGSNTLSDVAQSYLHDRARLARNARHTSLPAPMPSVSSRNKITRAVCGWFGWNSQEQSKNNRTQMWKPASGRQCPFSLSIVQDTMSLTSYKLHTRTQGTTSYLYHQLVTTHSLKQVLN